MFKGQNKLENAFRFKDRILKELIIGVVYIFQCGLCNECSESTVNPQWRHCNVKNGEHIGISSLTKKKVKLKGSAVSDYLWLCKHSLSFKNFSMLTKKNRKFVLELKESLLIKH